MTKSEAQRALDNNLRICAGEGEDYDTGWIHGLRKEPTRVMARVGWDSCQECEIDIDALELLDLAAPEPCGLHLGGIEGECRACGYGQGSEEG